MPIEISCTNCPKQLRVPDAAAGKAAKCPGCGAILKIPGPAAPPPAPPPAPRPAPPSLVPDLPLSLVPDAPALAPAPPPPTVPKPAPVSRPAAAPAGFPALELPASPSAPAPKQPAPPPKPPAKAPPPPPELVLDLPEEIVSEAHEEEVISEPLDDEVIGEAHEEEVISEIHDEEVINELPDDDPAEAAAGAASLVKDNPFEGVEIPPGVEEEIRKQLTKGEKIVWVGRQSLQMLQGYAQIGQYVGFGMLALGFLLSCLLGSVTFFLAGYTALIGSVCFGMFFLFVGGILACMPLIVKYTATSRAIYVLTNRNAHEFKPATVNNWKQVKKTTWDALKVANMAREDATGYPGSGSLVFEVRRQIQPTGNRGAPQEITIKLGFMQIEQVREVEHLIRETLVDRRIDRLVGGG